MSPLAFCSECPQLRNWLPAKPEGRELAGFERSVIHLPTLVKDQTVVTQGEPFEAFYALQRGVLKAVRRDRNDDEQVTAFHFPGTLLGFEEQWTGV